MSWFNGLQELISPEEKGKPKPEGMSEFEKRLILVVIAVVLLFAAIILLLVRSAWGTSGISACKGILLIPERNECYANLASRTADPSVCSYVSTSSGYVSCVFAIAEKTQNVTTCGKINPTYLQYDMCVDNISYASNDPGYCSLLNSQNQSVCAYSIAQKNGFSSSRYCSYISNGTLRKICGYVYDYSAAIADNAPSYCALLPNVTNSTLFSTIVSKGGTNSSIAGVDYFAYSTLNITPESFCYYKLSESTSNESYCGYTSGVLTSLCTYPFQHKAASANSINSSNITSYNNFTLNSQNINAICSKQQSYLQSICVFALYTDKAISEKNATACLQLTNSSYQYSCLTNLATKYNDSSYCNYIPNSTTSQQACVESAGVPVNGSS